VSPKVIIASAVVAGLLFLAILFALPRQSPSPITVRHVKSLQSNNVITMTFEIKNHTAAPYIFFPFEVRTRNGNTWRKFQGFTAGTIHPIPTLAPTGLASYTVDVTNLPAGSVVRFAIRAQETLLGVKGFVRRAELNVRNRPAGAGGGISLNPHDANSKVFGLPTEIESEDFIERENAK
jgi:hypothetical protein